MTRLEDLIKSHIPDPTIEEILANEKPDAVDDLHHMIATGDIGSHVLHNIIRDLHKTNTFHGKPPSSHKCKKYIEKVRGTR